VNVIEQKAAIGQKDKLFLKYKVTDNIVLMGSVAQNIELFHTEVTGQLKFANSF